MKSLEILYKIDTEYKYSSLNTDSCVRSYYVDEAIAELEALENINCDGCKYYLSDNGNYPLEPCGECSRRYSDRWESKQ